MVVAYREIRLLEEQALNLIALIPGQTQRLPECDVDQFYGIEIDPSAAQIATLALWLTDHQMNLRVHNGDEAYRRLPLKTKANIVCANALRINWAEVIKPELCSYIMGNPPFIGSNFQSKEQKSDCENIFKGIDGTGVLDYVAAWHIRAARYIQASPSIPVAFVSTNSLTQGGQVALLWKELIKLNIKLHFAHRTFQWSNEGKGIAAVHCVIMGFICCRDAKSCVSTDCRLFDYSDDIKGLPTENKAKQINPYLVDAPTVLIDKRSKPLCKCTPEMTNATNQPMRAFVTLTRRS